VFNPEEKEKLPTFGQKNTGKTLPVGGGKILFGQSAKKSRGFL